MWRKWIIILLAALALLIGGCASSSDDDDDSSGNGSSSSSDGFLYSSTKEVAPVIVDSSTTPSMLSDHPTPLAAIDTSNLPTVVRDIYSLLKNYDKDLPHDGQGVNMENLYRVLAAAEDWYDGGYDACNSITEQAIAAPYELFDSPRLYDCAINAIGETEASSDAVDISSETYAQGYAFNKSDSDVIQGLFGYRWSPTFATDGHYEHGVVEGSYDETTDDLTLRNVHLVNYDSASQSYGGFAVRAHIEGNVATHAFTFSTINVSVHRAGDVAGGAWEYNSNTGYTAVVGKGYSKAETAGTPKYLLFKATESGAAAVYYCLEVGVDGIAADAIAGLDATGDTIDASSDCFDYLSDVDTLYTNDLLGPTDVPYSLDGTGSEGFTGATIFLDYN